MFFLLIEIDFAGSVAGPTGIDVVYNFAEGSFLKFCTDFEMSLVADCAAICKVVFVLCSNCFLRLRSILQVLSTSPIGIDMVYTSQILRYATDRTLVCKIYSRLLYHGYYRSIFGMPIPGIFVVSG